MEIRGERECRECDTRWSYFETGSVACPNCGDVRSVGVGDGAVHTGGSSDLDLTAARAAIDDEPLDRVAELAAAVGREYRRSAGFVDAGELRPLDETDLVAAELETVGATLARAMRPDDAAENYLLTLLAGERLGPTEVPDAYWPERGLAVARAVGDFQRDLRTYRETVSGPHARRLSTIRAHRKRIEALDGDVDPRDAERLVRAARDLYESVVHDDEAALARIDDRLAE